MAPVEHKLLTYGILMVKMGLSYVKTYFLPVDDTFHSEFVLNRVACLKDPPCGTCPRKPKTKAKPTQTRNRKIRLIESG